MRYNSTKYIFQFSDKTNKTAPFPGCCPIFTCEDGVKLEYPELPTPPPEAEKKEEEKKA